MTILEICNSALVKCGAELITSTSDPAKRAVLVKTRYPFVKAKLLNKYSWNFAKIRTTLTAEATVPAFEYTAEYIVPDDYIRILKLDDSILKYKEEGGKILTDGSGDLKILYIADIEEADFPTPFGELLASALAMDICYSLVQSNTLYTRLESNFDMEIRELRSLHSQSGNGDEFIADTYTVVRY